MRQRPIGRPVSAKQRNPTEPETGSRRLVRCVRYSGFVPVTDIFLRTQPEGLSIRLIAITNTSNPTWVMAQDRLFLDRVGRHQSPSLLHRRDQTNTLFSC